MSLAIAVMVSLDLVLTVCFLSRGQPAQISRTSQPKLPVEKEITDKGVATKPSSEVTAAEFILLRDNDTGGARPYVSPSMNAEKWDFVSGPNAAQNWANWNGNPGQLKVNESYSYENPYPASSKP
jgi:hypothetical protein